MTMPQIWLAEDQKNEEWYTSTMLALLYKYQFQPNFFFGNTDWFNRYLQYYKYYFGKQETGTYTYSR